MRKMLIALFSVFVLSLSLLCVVFAGRNKVSDDFKLAVETYGKLLFAQDEDSALLDEVFSAIDVYLNDSNEETLENALNVLKQSRESLLDRESNCVPYEATEEEEESFDAYDISIEEIYSFDTSRAAMLSGYIGTLDMLEEYLEYENTDFPMREELEDTFYFEYIFQESNRRSSGLGINYWFAGISKAEKAYLDEQILNQMTSFTVENISWSDSREEVEERINIYYDDIEEVLAEWSVEMGEDQKDLMELEKMLDDLLK